MSTCFTRELYEPFVGICSTAHFAECVLIMYEKSIGGTLVTCSIQVVCSSGASLNLLSYPYKFTSKEGQ